MEEALRLLMEHEGRGFSATLERSPFDRTTDLIVSYRPRIMSVRKSMTDAAIEDSLANFVLDAASESASMARGAMIVEVLTSGRRVDFQRRLPLEQASGLVSGLLGALDDSKGVEQETAYTLGLRMVDIVTKHGDSATCERLALILMEHVERIRR